MFAHISMDARESDCRPLMSASPKKAMLLIQLCTPCFYTHICKAYEYPYDISSHRVLCRIVSRNES